MSNELRIGSILHGYCGGYFDDSYECKRVEFIAHDWLVVREIDSGCPIFYSDNQSQLTNYLTPCDEARCEHKA